MKALTPDDLRLALTRHSPRYQGARSNWRAVLIHVAGIALWGTLLSQAWTQPGMSMGGTTGVMAWSQIGRAHV